MIAENGRRKIYFLSVLGGRNHSLFSAVSCVSSLSFYFGCFGGGRANRKGDTDLVATKHKRSWAIVIIKSVTDRLFNCPPLSARYDDIRSENMRGKKR
jgi:hypothetical protein